MQFKKQALKKAVKADQKNRHALAMRVTRPDSELIALLVNWNLLA
jgi:hypothetical protein